MMKPFLGATALSLVAGLANAGSYTVTVTNNLEEELLAPILITSTSNDAEIFLGSYVTPEAEAQILTGDPAMLAARIGADAMVGHGADGPPGVLLAPGKSVTFDIETDATSVRVIAMVAPTLVPDNYVTNVVNLHGLDMAEVGLGRFDIGHDEGTMMIVSSDGMMEDEMMAEGSGDTMAEGSDTMVADDSHGDMGMGAMHSAATVTFTKNM